MSSPTQYRGSGATNTGDKITDRNEYTFTLSTCASFILEYFPMTLRREELEGWVIFTWVL